jgi:hypothetical protein
MLGMEMLSLFDVDFDWPAGRLRLYKPGEGAAVAEEAGLTPIPAAGALALALRRLTATCACRFEPE